MARINGINVELPKYTLKIARLLEEYDDIKKDVFNEKMKFTDALVKYYDILGEILGKEQTAKVVAGEDTEDVDVSKVLTAFIEIINTYKEPIEKAEKEKLAKELDAMNIKDLKALTDVIKVAGV